MCMVVAMSASAQKTTFVNGAEIDMAYDAALAALKAELGEPAKAAAGEVEFANKTYQGMKFEKIVYFFSNNKLSGARFYAASPSKATAVKNMETLANKLQSYKVARDTEDDGTPFYKGGESPVSYEHLFTIYTQKVGPKFMAILRYGPFEI